MIRSEVAISRATPWLHKVFPIPVTPTGCWTWSGSKNERGYGLVTLRGRTIGAHRVIYQAAVGRIPRGMQIDHLCRTTSCVNPAHMEAVTPRTNVRRSENPAATNARKTHCAHGHELTGENLYVYPHGARGCRRCNLDSHLRRNRATKARGRRSGSGSPATRFRT